MTETPPLTRGRPVATVENRFGDGNTPAYAGKTDDLLGIVVSHKETPPLTRGRRARAELVERSEGNTPAYAGKTRQRCRPEEPGRKHPRLRGEDGIHQPRSWRLWETPPLTRGRPHCIRLEPLSGRKHPRLRGEDFFGSGFDGGAKETPPLTRGRPGETTPK